MATTPLSNQTVTIPVQNIGPVHITGSEVCAEVSVPLATFESPMWPSTHRGASVSRRCGGIQASILADCMTRSIVLEASSAHAVIRIIHDLPNHQHKIKDIVASTSRFCQLHHIHHQAAGNLLFLRISATTGDASGHNMLTKAADKVIQWLCNTYPDLSYVSVSGNICIDKKVSAINGILGRGKHVTADIVIPHHVCVERLKTTPEAIFNLHHKKNLMGSILAGSLRSANAHFANLLYAIYLATGQDVANIVEGSQGITHVELRNTNKTDLNKQSDYDLYFSVTLPNVIVGTVGNGKNLPFVKAHLEQLDCLNPSRPPGANARRLAIIIGATVLCGELSLLAAQTNPGELMQAHEKYERCVNGTKNKI